MYANAWKCEQCPKTNDSSGCPAWVSGIVETNIATGEERITVGCMFPLIPRWLTLVLSASNRPAAAFESLRNEVVAAVNQERDSIVNAIESHGRKLIGA